jgi:hypothetical protein
LSSRLRTNSPWCPILGGAALQLSSLMRSFTQRYQDILYSLVGSNALP